MNGDGIILMVIVVWAIKIGIWYWLTSCIVEGAIKRNNNKVGLTAKAKGCM